MVYKARLPRLYINKNKLNLRNKGGKIYVLCREKASFTPLFLTCHSFPKTTKYNRALLGS